jgi:hypothetical protein
VEPTHHTHPPHGALHTSCSPPRQLRPLPRFAGVGAAPSPTSGGSERQRSGPPQCSPARAGGAPCPVAPCGGEEVAAADGYSRPQLGRPGGGRARRVLPAAAVARLLPSSPLPPPPGPSSSTPLPRSFPRIEWLEPWRWRRVPLPLRPRLPLLWRPLIEQSTARRLRSGYPPPLAGGPEDGQRMSSTSGSITARTSKGSALELAGGAGAPHQQSSSRWPPRREGGSSSRPPPPRLGRRGDSSSSWWLGRARVCAGPARSVCSVPRCMWRSCARTQRLRLLCRLPVRAKKREKRPPCRFAVAIQAQVRAVLCAHQIGKAIRF